jgi:hypothetical protein
MVIRKIAAERIAHGAGVDAGRALDRPVLLTRLLRRSPEDHNGMNFARRLFLIAGIYGLIALLPFYFMEARIGRDQPPAITHPEYFYGFLGVGVAWQVAFLVISRDPGRFRPLMIPSVLEKATFGIAAIALFVGGRVSGQTLTFGLIDVVLGVLFLFSYLRTDSAWVPRP